MIPKTPHEMAIRAWIDAHADWGVEFTLGELNEFLAQYGYPPATADQVDRLIPTIAEGQAQRAAMAREATKH